MAAGAADWRKRMEKNGKIVLSFKKVLGPIAVILMAAIVIMTFVNAFLRYTVGKNILSFEEYSRFCFVWICYIGTVIAYEQKRHICVDIIYSHIRGVAKSVIDIINHILVLCVSSVILCAGMLYFRRAVTNHSAATNTNMGVVVIGLPLMALCLISIELMDMYKQYVKKGKKSK